MNIQPFKPMQTCEKTIFSALALGLRKIQVVDKENVHHPAEWGGGSARANLEWNVAEPARELPLPELPASLQGCSREVPIPGWG